MRLQLHCSDFASVLPIGCRASVPRFFSFPPPTETGRMSNMVALQFPLGCSRGGAWPVDCGSGKRLLAVGQGKEPTAVVTEG